MLSERVKWWFRSRHMVTAGEKDLSSLPTAATRAWMISDTKRIKRPPRGWTLDMAWGVRVVATSSLSMNQAVGISESISGLKSASVANHPSLLYRWLHSSSLLYFQNGDRRP